MKLSTSLLPVLAVLSMAAGLITAVPAQAAVKLPAGCTTSESESDIRNIYEIACKTLSNGADFSGYTNLGSLEIGDTRPGYTSKATVTKLPKLPQQLNQLWLNAPKMTDYSGLSSAKQLRSLSIDSPNKQLSLSNVAKWNPSLEELYITGYRTAVDASPLSKLKNLEFLELQGKLPNIRLNQGSWGTATFPRGLNGQLIAPENPRLYDGSGRLTTNRQFDYDVKTSRIRFNISMIGAYWSTLYSTKATTAQPKLRSVGIEFDRTVDVATPSEWALDKKMKLILRGNPQVGKTVTAQLSDTSDMFKAYVDTWQWYRNGTPIKGATKPSYKIVSADVGKKITVKATDNKEEFGFGRTRYIPYSVTLTATHKAVYGFIAHKPSIAGTALPGKTLTAKFKKWGGSPTRYAYQWYRNGKAIKGATRVTYKAANADKGQKLTVKVTGSKKNYQTVSSTSVATSVAKMLNIQKPSIRYGQVFEEDSKYVVFSMIVSNGKWNFPATKHSYQWYRNGRAIKGATEYGLVVRTGTFDDKTKFTVKVTAKSKYGSASATSNGFNRWG